MTSRSKLDEIEDYHYAVKEFVNKGKSREATVEFLKQRGASEEQIKVLFETIHQNYQGVRLLESSKIIRGFNFFIDLTCIIIVCAVYIKLFWNIRYDGKSFILLLLVAMYYILPEVLTGMTVGKLITGSIVVDKRGDIPDVLKIIVRTFFRFIPNTLFSAVFSERISHDYYSATYVIDRKRWKAMRML